MEDLAVQDFYDVVDKFSVLTLDDNDSIEVSPYILD